MIWIRTWRRTVWARCNCNTLVLHQHCKSSNYTFYNADKHRAPVHFVITLSDPAPLCHRTTMQCIDNSPGQSVSDGYQTDNHIEMSTPCHGLRERRGSLTITWQLDFCLGQESGLKHLLQKSNSKSNVSYFGSWEPCERQICKGRNQKGQGSPKKKHPIINSEFLICPSWRPSLLWTSGPMTHIWHTVEKGTWRPSDTLANRLYLTHWHDPFLKTMASKNRTKYWTIPKVRTKVKQNMSSIGCCFIAIGLWLRGHPGFTRPKSWAHAFQISHLPY